MLYTQNSNFNINIFGYDWNVTCHTKWDNSNYDDAYFGGAGVGIIGTPTSLRLSVVKAPLKFETGDINPKQDGAITKQYCCGEVTGPCMTYGTYTWCVKMPSGKRLWPALWLCGYKTWPPEIDVVEGYSDKSGSYIKNIFTTSLESNCHMRDNMKANTHIALGAKGIPTVLYKLLHRDVDEYKCVWTKNYIKIFFNNVLVRSITNKKLLDDINDNPVMYPIMNMMIRDGYEQDGNNVPYMDIVDFTYKKQV